MNPSRGAWLAAGIVCALAAPLGSALAHPHDEAGRDSALAGMRERSHAELGLPNPTTSAVVGVLATGLPFALLAAEPNNGTATFAFVGIALGPVVGYAHGGVAGDGLRGAAARTLLLGVVLEANVRFDDEFEGSDDLATSSGWAVLGAAAGTLALASALWDLARLRGRVEAANHEVLHRRSLSLELVPMRGGLAVTMAIPARR